MRANNTIDEDKSGNESSKYRTLLNSANLGGWEYNVHSRKIWCSPEYFTILGRDINDYYANGELQIEDVWIDLLHPDDREKAQKVFAAYVQNPVGLYEQYFRLLNSNGTWDWIWSRGKSLTDVNGHPNGIIVGTHIVVTPQKETEENILRTRNLLNKAESLSNTGSTEIDLITGKRYWSDEFYAVLGYIPGSIEPSAEGFTSRLIEGEKERYTNWLNYSVNNRVINAKIETKITRFDNGSERDLLIYGSGAFNELGEPIKIFGVIQDITEKKITENKIKVVQDLLERAENVAKIGSSELDLRTGEVLWSEELYRIFGVEPNSVELKKGVFGKHLHPNEQLKYENWLAHSLELKLEAAQLESSVLRPDGQVRNVIIYGNATYSQTGVPQKVYGVIKDITEEKKIQLELERSKQVYQSLFFQNPAAVFSVDLTGRFTSANNIFAYKAELDLENVLKLNLYDFVQGENKEIVKQRFENAKKGNSQEFEIEIVTAKGNILLVSALILPIVVDGKITGVYGITNNITEKRNYIRAIEEQNQKLKEIAWFQSHVVRAPLARIMGLAGLIKEELKDGAQMDQMKDLLNYIVDSANEMDIIIGEIVRKTDEVNVKDN